MLAPFSDSGRNTGGSMIPGVSIGGSAGDGGTTSPTGSLGSSTNPFLAPYPSGQGTNPQTVPDPSSFTTPGQDGTPIDLQSIMKQFGGPNSGISIFDPNTRSSTSPTAPTPNTSGLNPATTLGFNNAGISPSQLGNELSNANIYPSGVGNLLGQFLKSGAGFNPQVAQALINALGPQIQAGQTNIMEQFGSQGLRDSSPAALGLADFNSKVTLAEGQIFAQEYDQAVQNYMNVLTGMKMHDPKETIFGDIAALLSGLGGAGGIASLIKAISGLGKKPSSFPTGSGGGQGPQGPQGPPGAPGGRGDAPLPPGAGGDTTAASGGLPGHEGWTRDPNTGLMVPPGFGSNGYDSSGNYDPTVGYDPAGLGNIPPEGYPVDYGNLDGSSTAWDPYANGDAFAADFTPIDFQFFEG